MGADFLRHPKGHRADVLSISGPPSAKKSVWSGKRDGTGAMEPLTPQHKEDWEWVSKTDLVFYPQLWCFDEYYMRGIQQVFCAERKHHVFGKHGV